MTVKPSSLTWKSLKYKVTFLCTKLIHLESIGDTYDNDSIASEIEDHNTDLTIPETNKLIPSLKAGAN